MSVKQVTCYIATCDDCDDEYEHDYTPHWPDAGGAIDDAVEGGDWWSKEGALLCRVCRDKPHAFLPSEVDPEECDRCPDPADEHAGGQS